MHDYGEGDIPIIVANWSKAMPDKAFDYWVQLSKDEWSIEEQVERGSLIF